MKKYRLSDGPPRTGDTFMLRRAEREDRSRIRSLVRRAHLNPMSLAWRRFMVLTDARATFVGCAQVKRHTDGTRELASLVVREPFRGRGGARVLIEHFITSTRRPLYLMCRSELRPFYERFGFSEVPEPELPRYFRRIRLVSRVMQRVVRQPGPTVMKIS